VGLAVSGEGLAGDPHAAIAAMLTMSANRPRILLTPGC
jgi:hypothetical protein